MRDQALTGVELVEVESLGSVLTREPAALFCAGELLWLTSLAQHGARTFAHLEKLRQLKWRVEQRRQAGWWLDPSSGD